METKEEIQERSKGYFDLIDAHIYEKRVLHRAIARCLELGLKRARLAYAQWGRAHQQFHDTMNDAVSDGRITLGQYAELAEAGLIVRGSNRRHAVFEVSVNPDNDDITRALKRAEILRQATGDTVTAAVITHQPNPEFVREAETKGVKVLDIAP